MPASAVKVSGLSELLRAFNRLEKSVALEFRTELAKASEPVRVSAEHLAFSRITNIGSIWGRMRLGVTTSGAYIALATRRRLGTGRPNFGSLSLEEAMIPAVEANQPGIFRAVETWMDRITRESGF